ncbi:glutamate 5-kinase [Tindallia californiensis]|uniref:Glutamate 5-kinase n=1 Tax=Tindallia californiensis TaxID=159292 RepID=A0A1H3MRG5_9FIRM|nr:glutamate 5-kinase [Tindallia californiensis]SDY79084.1 glutamate 5-kinase [Tindallia californiensis]
MHHMKDVEEKRSLSMKRMVIKVGTSTLTHANGRINYYRMDHIARQIADIKNMGYEVTLVSSGAIGSGMGKMGLRKKPSGIPQRQALAAVGQGVMMHMYEKFFGEYSQIVAQVLLTRDDINSRERYLNARHTLTALHRYDVIPIVNENDTISFDEIRFGDNDNLAALTAVLVDADLLVLLSDIDGLYQENPQDNPEAPFIETVTSITEKIESMAGKPGSNLGSGGMITKIEAAKIATNNGIPMILANGSQQEVLLDIVEGKKVGTLFLPKEHRMGVKKGWIGFASKTEGEITVDEGAENALRNRGKSLLPSGITSVKGTFEKGSVISILGKKGEIARGISNYGFNEIDKIKGCQSKDIEKILGYCYYMEVIHRDHLTLL